MIYSGDGVENVREAVLAMRQRSPDMILCTGGMSVDPDDNTPGCVMYAGATIFDLILPKVTADIPVTRSDIAALGEGGLCLGCKECHYPICPFGK